MILKEDFKHDTVMIKAVSKVSYGDVNKGDIVYVYKTIPGLKDLSVHKAVIVGGDKVHYFFNHELDI
ncbi:hypothetical protein WYMAN_83 [Vibrio phage Wyman]|nr:hypothetical protein WYMAN_83 [Vibrio phage Wyman]